jgi:hypothetical protein
VLFVVPLFVTFIAVAFIAFCMLFVVYRLLLNVYVVVVGAVTLFPVVGYLLTLFVSIPVRWLFDYVVTVVFPWCCVLLPAIPLCCCWLLLVVTTLLFHVVDVVTVVVCCTFHALVITLLHSGCSFTLPHRYI